MAQKKIEKAFILAAGQGTRLKPHTNDKPKPMVCLDGKPLIRYIIDKIKDQGINNIIINLFYLGDRIKDYLKDDNETLITFSEETDLLDTGGGVKNALAHLNGEDFFLINGDAFWIDTPDFNALEELSHLWDSTKMDILLLLQPIDKMPLTEAVGDYDLDENGRAMRNHEKKGQYMFTGVRVSRSNLFDETPDGAFSFLEIMDRAEENGRLYGLINQGEWHHISIPQDLENVEAYIQRLKAA